jgi:DNA-binding IclR family transcriptional regulator
LNSKSTNAHSWSDRAIATAVRRQRVRQKEPKVLVRIIGQAPLAATVYSLERLRCGACGQVFTAQEPEAVGPEKYDKTAAAMIAQLKYGAGTPFYRLEQLEKQLGHTVTGGYAVGDRRRHGAVDQAGAG